MIIKMNVTKLTKILFEKIIFYFNILINIISDRNFIFIICFD